MRARHGDLEVCPRCNGTGTRVYWFGERQWAVPCLFTGFERRGQLSLLPLESVKRAKARLLGAKRRRSGNRWHSKN